MKDDGDDLRGVSSVDSDDIDMSDEDGYAVRLLEKYSRLREVTQRNMPSLWTGLEFALSVKTILNIRDCTLPFAGIILGPASSLKTICIELFRGTDNTFYTDNFSAKALVSHNSAIAKDKLKDVDMLPKIKNKFFLTPELAPTFAQKEEELIQTLGIMTRILDGHGYESDTGAQGHRGYSEDIMFTWLGAAVDIPYKVHKQLSVLGPKLYFFRLPKAKETEDYYYNKKAENFAQKKLEIRSALDEYLDLFETNTKIVKENENPLSKIPLNHEKDEEMAHRYIIRVAQLLAHLRAIVPTWETQGTQGSDYAYTFANIEDPSRAITQLRNLARGHALSRGRSYITEDDVPIIIQVALSTASMERVRILDLLIANNGKLTTSQIVDFLNTTNPTARRTMTELKAIELVDMSDSDVDRYNSGKEIELKSEFKWFLSDKFAELRGLKRKKVPEEEGGGLKEKNTPRAPPTLLSYDNMVLIKKLNLLRDSSFSQDERARGGHFSFKENNVIGESVENIANNIDQMQDGNSKPNAGHIYRLGNSDTHACQNCRLKGDIHFMSGHNCRGYISEDPRDK